MSTVAPEKTRNIAVIAPGGAGKTTLIETLLFQAHEISTRQRSADATMRVEPEEAEHKIAITPHVGHFSWNGTAINLVDTPGYFNFLESTRGVLPGVDGSVLIVSGVEGVKPETERLWAMLQQAALPVLGFVNQMDDEHADYMRTIKAVSERLKVAAQPITIPIRAGAGLQGIVDILRLKAWATKDGKSTPTDIPEAMQGDIKTLRTQLVERIAEASDDLIEKYLNGEELSNEELEKGLKQAVLKRTFIPLLCGSALANSGVDALIEAIVQYLPNPLERDADRPFNGFAPNDHTNEIKRGCDPSAPFSAIVLKTTIDPFSGKLSVVRVVSGQVTSNQPIINSTQQVKQKAAHVYVLQGKTLQSVGELSAGQIGAISKLDETHTGETLCDPDSLISYPVVKYAEPPVSYAVEPADLKNEEKVASGLNKLMEEDPTLHIHRDEQTHEMIISGMGQSHIEMALERLTRKFGGKAKLKTPRVPYRETIRKTVKIQGKVKKQTGGHGQFANCWLEVGPLARNGGFEFVDLIVGGIIPKQYIPSIKKGVQEAMLKGILGGYPVVDLKVSVYDGSYHDVDSSDFAFQTAGSLALKAAMEQADAVLLEPIMALDITIPEESTGDVLKDLSSRRGRVVSLNSKGKDQHVEAEAPMAEMLEYGNILSALTSGRGVYTMSVAHYKEVPGHIQERVLEKVKQEAAANAKA